MPWRMRRERAVGLTIDYVALVVLLAVAIGGAVMLAVGNGGTGGVLLAVGLVAVLVKANLIRLKLNASRARR